MIQVDVQHRLGSFELKAQFMSEGRVTALFGRSGSGRNTHSNPNSRADPYSAGNAQPYRNPKTDTVANSRPNSRSDAESLAWWRMFCGLESKPDLPWWRPG